MKITRIRNWSDIQKLSGKNDNIDLIKLAHNTYVALQHFGEKAFLRSDVEPANLRDIFSTMGVEIELVNSMKYGIIDGIDTHSSNVEFLIQTFYI